MKDIVKAMRDRAGSLVQGNFARALLREGADEIERLRSDVTRGMTNHNAGIEEWERARKSELEAFALLRELNDELKIPGWLQPRVDAVLDRAEEKR